MARPIELSKHICNNLIFRYYVPTRKMVGSFSLRSFALSLCSLSLSLSSLETQAFYGANKEKPFPSYCYESKTLQGLNADSTVQINTALCMHESSVNKIIIRDSDVKV